MGVIDGNFTDAARDFQRLARIAPARPDLAHLAALAGAFSRLPYENFTKIIRASEHADIGKRLRTPDIVLGDHMDMGAGGTCFSLTHFFRRVLENAGFDCAPALCDRSYGPDTHCALIVAVGDARYLVDPGYLMDRPMPVPEKGESLQERNGGALRLARLGESSQLMLTSERGGARKIRYRLRDAKVSDDLFLKRWIDSFGWPMMRHLCVSRHTPDGQLYMRDGRMRIVGEGAKNQVRLDAGFDAEVERAFGIDRRLVSMAHDALRRPR